MKKRNAYSAMVMFFIAGMAFLSDKEHNVLIAVIALTVAVFLIHGWGLDYEEVNSTDERTGTGNKAKGA